MAQDRFGIYPAVFVHGGGTLNLQQVGRVAVRPDARKDLVVPGGNLDASANIMNFADPVVQITTEDVTTALTTISVTAGLAVTTTTIQFQKRADRGGFSSGSVHTVLSGTLGFLFPTSLGVDQDEENGAKLDLEWRGLWDGLSSGVPAQPTPPLTISAAAALTSTPAFSSRLYQGPIYTNVTALEGIVGWRCDFGLDFNTKRGDGDLYARMGSIFSRKPRLTFRVLKASYLSTIGSMFQADPGAALHFYLRRGTNLGARVADATASHAKLTMATGAFSPESVEVAGEDDATVTVMAQPTGTLSISVASAVP